MYQRITISRLIRFSLATLIGAVITLAPHPGAAQGLCGNGVLDAGESCDDNNLRDDDCCSSSCELVECDVRPVSLVVWEAMGPFSIGGRITALAVDPVDRLRVIAGTPSGGLWHSLDGGASWEPLTPWLSITPISALAIDPADPDVIIAGTGSISDGGSVSPGLGIIQTTDGGDSWFRVTNGQIVPYISSLLFWDPEPDRVLAATDLGVMVSVDGGSSFDFVLQGQAISDLKRDPFDADTVYATSRTGLHVSSNRGDSWTRVSEWPLGEEDDLGAGTTALAVSSQTPGLLYAAVQVFANFSETDRGLLLRSTDGGSSFDELAVPESFCETVDSCGFGLSLAIHPDDDQRLLLGGDGLQVTADGGGTWTVLSDPVSKVHEIVLHEQGGYVAGASGVADFDGAWTQATTRNDGLAVTSVVSLDVSDDIPARLLAGTADTGTILNSGEGPEWETVFGLGETAGTARFDPFDEDKLYVSRPNARFYRSDDGGQTFTAIQEGLDLEQVSAEVTPFEPSMLVPDTLFTALEQPFQSTDAGESWHVFRPPGFPEVTQIAASPVDGDRLYFALADGAVLFKADDIHTESMPITTESNLRITSIFLDPGAENILYTTLANPSSQTGRIFKSWDFGVNWQDITPAGLPTTTSIVKDAYGALYVGNTDGVWRSANDGFSWARFQTGLLGSAVNRLGLGAERLYAGTPGRGVFSVPVLGLTSIESIPDGQLFWVDDVLVRTPHFELWEPGSVHSVEPYLLQTADSRQAFGSWSDGGAPAHEVIIGQGTSAITAAVRNLFELRLEASPPSGGSIAIEPSTARRFFDENTVVSWVAVPSPHHRFTGFTGDLSGGQDHFGFAVMDRPRSVVANFEPLVTAIATDPPGLDVRVNGRRTATPASYEWSVGTVHELAADEFVDLDPGDPAVLAFDSWSDLFPRVHDVTVRRDTFVTALIARYITIIPELEIPQGASRFVRTEGERVAARMASLTIVPGDTEARPALQFLRGVVENELIMEAALAPARSVDEVHVFVEGGSDAGPTRLVVHNPGSDEAVVDLLLRDADGVGLVAREAALTIEPGGYALGLLRELIALADPYEGLLSVFADQPVMVSVQSVRSNQRSSTFLDPILVVPPLESDLGVPGEAVTQALLLTSGTEHRLVLSNPSFGPISGTVRFLNEEGQPLALSGGLPSERAYDLAAGGYEVVSFVVAGGGGAIPPVTARVRLEPTGSQDPPQVQLEERQTVGFTVQGPIVLPRTIPPSRRCASFAVPVDLERRDSGVIVGNPGSSPSIGVDLSLVDLEGNEVASENVVLAGDQQRLLLAGELFPGIDPGFRGVLVGSGSSELDAVGVLFQINGRGEQIIAGFPAPGAVWEDPPADPSSVFPFAVDGDSWSSEWWVVNSNGGSAANVTYSFAGPDGETVHLPMELE